MQRAEDWLEGTSGFDGTACPAVAHVAGFLANTHVGAALLHPADRAVEAGMWSVPHRVVSLVAGDLHIIFAVHRLPEQRRVARGRARRAESMTTQTHQLSHEMPLWRACSGLAPTKMRQCT